MERLARAAPRPPEHWLWGALPERKRLGAGFYGEMARRHGDVVAFRLATWSVVYVARPDLARTVLHDRREHYPKGGFLDPLRALLGNGLLLSDGETWRRQRRTVQPVFQHANLVAFPPLLQRCIDEALPALDAAASAGPVDLYAWMARITLDMAGRSLFGVEVDSARQARIGEGVDRVMRLLDEQMFHWTSALPSFVPTPLSRRIGRAAAELRADVEAAVTQRLAAKGGPRDILGLLLAAAEAQGEAADRTELRDQVLTFYMAGHETTACALGWCWKLLAEHPDEQERVAAEALAAFDPASPSIEAAQRLPKTVAAFQEAMRLYPPGWTITREADRDDELDGIAIPKGSNVLVCPYALHRDPRYWDDPDVFRPARFPLSPERKAAYLPFGTGSRSCIGTHFAMLEAALVLGTLLRRYRVEAMPEHPVGMDLFVTLRPAPGVRVRLTRR